MKTEELEEKVDQYESDLKDGKKKNDKSAFKYVMNISFVLIVTVLSVFFSVKDNATIIRDNLIKIGSSWENFKWMLVVLGIVFAIILIRSFILFCFARLYTRTYKFHQAMAVDQIGQFYNAVTPGSSGGQIMQAYIYKKQGVPVSSAVSILAMYSIVFQSILIIYGTVSFIVKYDFITSLGDINTGIAINGQLIKLPIWPLTIVGFLLNVGLILLVLLMGYWHSFHNFVMGPIISLLAKIKLVKNPDKTRENLRIQVENFKIEFRRLMTNVRFTILVAVSFTLYMMLKFSVPFFVGKALGNESTVASFWDSIFLSNYHQMVTGLIPVPGSAGVSEFFFYQLFVNGKDPASGFFYASGINSPELSKAMCNSALIIWRFSTFTFPLIAAGFVSAFYRSSVNPASTPSGMPNRQTFIALQNETYVQRREEVDAAIQTQVLSRTAVFEMLRTGKKSTKKTTSNLGDPEEYENLEIRDDGDDD